MHLLVVSQCSLYNMLPICTYTKCTHGRQYSRARGRGHVPPIFGDYSKIFNFHHWCPPPFIAMSPNLYRAPPPQFLYQFYAYACYAQAPKMCRIGYGRKGTRQEIFALTTALNIIKTNYSNSSNIRIVFATNIRIPKKHYSPNPKQEYTESEIVI